MIPTGNIRNERLKLLSTFKAIFDERSLVGAAEVLGCTQSAVSKQLQKLRYWFKDDLFLRTPGGMQPTETSLNLIDEIQLILTKIDGLVTQTFFDPAVLEGNFVIETTDEISRRIAPPLMQQLYDKSPKLKLVVRRLEKDYSVRELETGEVDLVISVNWHAPDRLMQKRLFSDQFVVVMSKRHPLARKSLTVQNYADAHHVLVAPLGMRRGYIDDVLAQQGLTRRVSMSVPTFAEMTPEILSDKYIVTLPNQVAVRLANDASLAIHSLPFDVPMISYHLLWHRRFSSEPRSQWLRGMIEDILVPAAVPPI